MSAHHGNTPAAWTAVLIGLAGFLIGAVGLMASSMTLFWIGVICQPVALVAAFVLSRAAADSADADSTTPHRAH